MKKIRAKDMCLIMYVMVDKRGNLYTYSLSQKKKECIGKFLLPYPESKKDGWSCQKVDVDISSAENYFDCW